VGLVPNYFINPLTYLDPAALSWGLYGLNVVSTRANLLGASDLLENAAIDRYSFVRNAYLQRRRYLISEGRGSNNLPDYGEGTALPKYDEEEGAAPAAAATGAAAGAAAPASAAAGAAVPASGATRAAAPGAAGVPATLEGPAGAAAPAGASETTVPSDQMIPPARIGYPGLLRLH